MPHRRGETNQQKQQLLRVARGLEKADLFLRDAPYLNLFSRAWEQGDIAIEENGRIADELRLPLAGPISAEPLEEVNANLERLKALAASFGVGDTVDPFMTLSFMSLPVIPTLRILTGGVFSAEKWGYISN